MAKEKNPVHKVQMTEGKRQIIPSIAILVPLFSSNAVAFSFR